jgi:hypothetical protein
MGALIRDVIMREIYAGEGVAHVGKLSAYILAARDIYGVVTLSWKLPCGDVLKCRVGLGLPWRKRRRSSLARRSGLAALTPPKCFGQDGLVEFRQEPRRVGVLGGDTVEPSESGFHSSQNAVLFLSRGQTEFHIIEIVLVHIWLTCAARLSIQI